MILQQTHQRLPGQATTAAAEVAAAGLKADALALQATQTESHLTKAAGQAQSSETRQRANPAGELAGRALNFHRGYD